MYYVVPFDDAKGGEKCWVSKKLGIKYQRNVGIKGCLREFKGEEGIGGEEGV